MSDLLRPMPMSADEVAGLVQRVKSKERPRSRSYLAAIAVAIDGWTTHQAARRYSLSVEAIYSALRTQQVRSAVKQALRMKRKAKP